uniref:Uncharacterized protein n=1 Tax=Anguilla anguilla TaxID=7936 RepID=A0A0E9TVE9_ANGAN
MLSRLLNIAMYCVATVSYRNNIETVLI